MSVRKRRWTNAKGETKEVWQVDYVDTNGDRRRQSFAKKKDADAFHARATVEVSQGVHVPDSATITIEEAGKLWIKSGTAAGLERTSLDQRRQHLELHIKPFIGKTKLSKVTVPFVRSFQDMLREAGRSAAMIKRVAVSLGSILSDAQGRGLVVRNAVHEMSRARSGQKKAERRQKAKLRVGVDIPTNTEIRAIIGAAAGRYRPLLITAVFTGLRASELRGLRWEDVDLGKAQLHVRQRADKYQDMGMPKSDAGQRTIPLPPMVVSTLREWKLAGPKSDLGLVFANQAGRIEYHQNMLQRGLWPTLLNAHVAVATGKKDEEGNLVLAPKYTGFHALRHWYASWCINRKVDGGLELTPKQVQERMGHSSIQVTFDTYGHLFPSVDETRELEAAQLALLGGTAGT
ncbi:integrase [Devosia geojensis]|uniref:Integrase n=1 Tax=Devosia geojensis TaxID=443610 RepID=A0A0F5FU45_9HYPH|nr:site-specific integrase [Devosia geojensis]KKB12394.1 integrase [Devosia geojensis]